VLSEVEASLDILRCGPSTARSFKDKGDNAAIFSPLKAQFELSYFPVFLIRFLPLLE
jgi:hypothetical protein